MLCYYIKVGLLHLLWILPWRGVCVYVCVCVSQYLSPNPILSSWFC